MNAACGRGSIRRANNALADRRRVCLCLKSKNYNHEGCREGGDQLHVEEVLCEVSVLDSVAPRTSVRLLYHPEAVHGHCITMQGFSAHENSCHIVYRSPLDYNR